MPSGTRAMGDTTNIGWCDHTFNAWIGCHKISPACKHCYAAVETFTRVQRGRGLELWGADAERHITSDANWRKPLSWNRAAVADGVRRRVFCSSLSDVFEKREGEVGAKLNAARARLWELIAGTPQLDWLLLTKRPENITSMVPPRWVGWAPHNLWLGTTVEDQAHADQRIPVLLAASAAVYFVSAEPLLGPLDISRYIAMAPRIVCTCARDGAPLNRRCNQTWTRCNAGLHRVRWVITGGESGSLRRACDPAWFAALAKQCSKHKAAFFMKQDSAFKSGQQGRIPDAVWALKQFPEQARS